MSSTDLIAGILFKICHYRGEVPSTVKVKVKFKFVHVQEEHGIGLYN